MKHARPPANSPDLRTACCSVFVDGGVEEKTRMGSACGRVGEAQHRLCDAPSALRHPTTHDSPCSMCSVEARRAVALSVLVWGGAGHARGAKEGPRTTRNGRAGPPSLPSPSLLSPSLAPVSSPKCPLA
eukprot:220696-Rhodomonas_salina.2